MIIEQQISGPYAIIDNDTLGSLDEIAQNFKENKFKKIITRFNCGVKITIEEDKE